MQALKCFHALAKPEGVAGVHLQHLLAAGCRLATEAHDARQSTQRRSTRLLIRLQQALLVVEHLALKCKRVLCRRGLRPRRFLCGLALEIAARQPTKRTQRRCASRRAKVAQEVVHGFDAGEACGCSAAGSDCARGRACADAASRCVRAAEDVSAYWRGGDHIRTQPLKICFGHHAACACARSTCCTGSANRACACCGSAEACVGDAGARSTGQRALWQRIGFNRSDALCRRDLRGHHVAASQGIGCASCASRGSGSSSGTCGSGNSAAARQRID